jgi:hypothetical protein
MQRLLESRKDEVQATAINEATEEDMKYEGTTNVMLSHDELVRAARQYGGISEKANVINVISTIEDGKPAILVMFEPPKPGEDVVYAKPKVQPAQPVPQIIIDPKHRYACELLAYLYKELEHMPPHLEVVDVSEHRHFMRHMGEDVYTGEVTACFRLFGDPAHYDEGRPLPIDDFDNPNCE